MVSMAFCPTCLLPRAHGTRQLKLTNRFTQVTKTDGNRAKLETIKRIQIHAKISPSFGRGVLFPKRLVGLYELERLGVNTKELIAPDSRDELGFSLAIATTVIATIGVPLVSPAVNLEAPAAVLIGTALVFWAVDTLALDGVLSRALSAMVADRRRIALHEAGHFLVSHLLGISVTDYELLSAKRVLGSVNGKKLASGVQIDSDKQKLDAYMLSAVGMAGISAEVLNFGKSEGGIDDMAEVSRLAKEVSPGRMTEEDLKKVCRWGLMQGVTLLKAHPDALLTLTDAMMDGRSVEDCTALIDASVVESNLKPMEA